MYDVTSIFLVSASDESARPLIAVMRSTVSSRFDWQTSLESVLLVYSTCTTLALLL